MAKKYISLGKLSIASELLNFVNNELLPGTVLLKKNFGLVWINVSMNFRTKNKNLLRI